MPIYNVKCEECEAITEMLIKHEQVDENDNVKECVCPICGKDKMKKILSVEGGSFKCTGKGWFKTGGY